MKTVKNTGSESVTIRRFDTGVNVELEPNVEVELDNATADFILTQVYRKSGEIIAQFVEVV